MTPKDKYIGSAEYYTLRRVTPRPSKWYGEVVWVVRKKGSDEIDRLEDGTPLLWSTEAAACHDQGGAWRDKEGVRCALVPWHGDEPWSPCNIEDEGSDDRQGH